MSAKDLSNALPGAHYFNGAMRTRRYGGRDTAVQEVLKTVYVPGSDENRVGPPAFRFVNKDGCRVAVVAYFTGD